MAAYTVCPKCHSHETSTEKCSRCGTVFSEWYAERQRPKEEIVEREMARLRAYERKAQLRRRVIFLVVAAMIVGGLVLFAVARLLQLMAFTR